MRSCLRDAPMDAIHGMAWSQAAGCCQASTRLDTLRLLPRPAPPPLPWQVPVVTYTEGGATEVLYESLALLDWAEDVKPSPSLMPAGATARTKARIAIARCAPCGVHGIGKAPPGPWGVHSHHARSAA